MDIRNLLNLAFMTLNFHYQKFKNDYRKKSIILYFNLLYDQEEDEYCNHPFGLVTIVRSIKTKKIQSHVFTEDIIDDIDEPAEKLIILKIKEMIHNVDS